MKNWNERLKEIRNCELYDRLHRCSTDQVWEEYNILGDVIFGNNEYTKKDVDMFMTFKVFVEDNISLECISNKEKGFFNYQKGLRDELL